MAFDETLRGLLDEVIGRRAPLLRHLARAPDPGLAGDADLDEACQALTDEYVEAGFGPDGVATERGLLLGKLIDEVNRPRFRRVRGR